MSYKIGGGDHLQPYSAKNGQYEEAQEKAGQNENDTKNLVLVHYFGFSKEDLPFCFPTYGVHDVDYCDIFVKYSRARIKGVLIDERKAVYLLTYKEKDDKSLFLNKLGYNENEKDKLLDDIRDNTDIKTLTFSRFEEKCLKCEAKTILKGNIVTSIWELKENLEIRFITLIPGGEKRWK